MTTPRSASGDPADLLAHAGYTHRLADGLYTLLPLGQRVLRRVNAVVRAELARVGAQEITMPLLQPEELWERPIGHDQTRAAAFGSQLFRIPCEDRLILAPTHEEVATVIAAACIRQKGDLPRLVYQIQPRFRNQVCSAQGGLLQTREFVMADAYSFHADRASLDDSYEAVKNAFCAVASRCGAGVDIVSADSGVMGGEGSEELVAPLPRGAGPVALRCSSCPYAASAEIAEFARTQSHDEVTPAVEEVAAACIGNAEFSSDRRLTWLPFLSGGHIVLAVTAGNLFLNAAKFVRALSRAGIGTADLRQASAAELARLGATYDWISLVRTPASVLVIADEAVRAGAHFLIPSPRAGHFLINVNSGRDFRVDMFADISVAADGAPCARCGNPMRAIRGVEVGHVFKLGSSYAAAFGADIADSATGRRPLEMGCYGLGVTRLMATVVEQKRDLRGIVWPESIAPFDAIIVPLQESALSFAEQLHAELGASGSEVLLDDSDAAAEEKLHDADLLGIPLQVVLSGCRNRVEIRQRTSSDCRYVPAAEVNALLRSRAEAYGIDSQATLAQAAPSSQWDRWL